ncbi:MAG: hypothetical protein HOL92_16555 [Opitutales bacterium]|nr:hypothetical protein [Opitutales bacterium]
MKKSYRRPANLKPAILIASCASLFLLGLAYFAVGAESVPTWTLFLGRFHPALLHLPIGFLVVLGVIEYLDSSMGGPRIGKACEIVLKYTAYVSTLAAVLGILLALDGGYNDDLLARHRWLGCITAVSVFWLIVLRTRARDRRRNGFSIPYHGALGATIILLLVVGHDGGTLTHGSGYLTKYLPNPIKSVIGMELEKEPGSNGFKVADVYQDIIHPIFEETCIACHGVDKSKGDLRLDSFELAMQGGELGDTIIPGDIDASEIIYRLHLDLDDDERMPPEGKRQPSDSQIAILEWWVESGAPDAGLLSELELPETIEAAINAQLEQPAFVAEAETMVAELDVPSWEEIAATVAELQEDPRINVQPIALDSPLIRVKSPFGESKFDDEALAMLAPVAANIAELEIGFSNITNEGLATLSGMHNLERLYLQKTTISDEGLEHVANLENLRYLNLYGTQVSDDGLEYLEDLDQLQSLYLWETQVTSEGAEAFRSNALDQSQVNAWKEEIQALKQKINQSGVLVETGAEAGPSS